MAAVEIPELRTYNAKHYSRDDGLREVSFSGGAIHYQSAVDGPWLDKKRAFRVGPGTNEWISDESDVAMRTYQVGSGGSRRWWVAFQERVPGVPSTSWPGIEFELSYQPTTTVGSNVLSFADGGGGTWTYTHTKVGGKMLGPLTPSSGGPRTYGPFPYRLLGGAPPLTQNADGSISCGNVFNMAAPHIVGANGHNYANTSWILDTTAQTLRFVIDDTNLPQDVFPYRVDPTTTFIATGAQDYKVHKSGTPYPPPNGPFIETTGTAISAEEVWSGSEYFISNGFMHWDTGSLSDTLPLVSARLSAYVESKNGTRTLNMGWFVGTTSTADWTATPRTSAISGLDISTFGFGVVEFPLVGFSSGISRTSWTGLSMHMSSGQPSSTNNTWISAFEAASAQEPRLLVVYDADPGAPNPATNLSVASSFV